MKNCIRCNHENEDYANHCSNCGYSFVQEQNSVKPVEQKIPDSYKQQYNYQQNNTMQYNNQNVTPQNKKSKVIGLLLNIILVGLGYAYVGKWGEGLVLLVLYLLMWVLGFLLVFPWIIAIALWIYSLFKTNQMIDNYNNGIPY